MDLQQDRKDAIVQLKKLEKLYCDALEALPRKKGMRTSEKAMTGALYKQNIMALRVAVRTINRTLEAEGAIEVQP